MHSSLVKLALALASASAVSAQTWTDCNPMKQTCANDPALAGLYTYTFGQAAPDFSVTAGSDVIKYDGSNGATFRVQKKGDAPTIQSNFYIMFGKIEVVMKAAPGGGVVSSVVLESNDLDEIDWEWVGSQPNQAQSNYFGKGNTGAYDRGAVHQVASQSDYHKYGLTWTKDSIEWIIDDQVVRTLTPAQVSGDYYPQTPMQLKIGSWAAGDPSNAAGTVEWSGGPINYGAGPYDMLVKSIMVQDYSTGTEYQYTDKSGSWESIKAINGEINAGPQTGKGNAASLASVSAAPSGSASSIGSAQGPGGPSTFSSPSNGLVVSATPTSKPSGSGNSGSNTDSSESAQQTSSSPLASGLAPSGSAGFANGYGNGSASGIFYSAGINKGLSTATVSGSGAAATNGSVPIAPSSPLGQQVGSTATKQSVGLATIVAGVMFVGWFL